MAKITQRQRVLQFIKENGSITRSLSAIELGCYELAARIVELEREGYRFAKKYESGRNRYGDITHWIRYSLADGHI